MRWTTNDPIGFGGGDTNTYRYVGNGPGNGLDPSGLQVQASSQSKSWAPLRVTYEGNTLGGTPVKHERHISATEMREKLGFSRLKGWFWWEYTAEELQFIRGCIGLCTLRLNCRQDGLNASGDIMFKEPTNVPGTRAFSNLKDALELQEKLANENTSDKIVVIWAMQANGRPSDLDEYLLDGSCTEYEVPRIGGARELQTIPEGEGGLSCFDFATAFQNPDGTIKFWEDMPYGQSSNFWLTTTHKERLYGTGEGEEPFATVYFVSVIDRHKREPEGIVGKK